MTLPPLDSRRGRHLIARLPHAHVLVVGDVMVDRFIVGDVARISPEAPVPVVRFQSEHTQLGGAANVAHNLVALGARVSLVGVVGNDRGAERLREQLKQAGIPTEFLIEDANRPTVEKVRVVTGRHQQVVRIDYENDSDMGADVERQVVRSTERAGADANVVIVSDYLKGAITKAVVQSLMTVKNRGAILIVDPKIPHLDYYDGASIVTPNQHEAEIATHCRIRSDEDAHRSAVDFRTRTRCDAVLITRGEHGMWLSSDAAEGAIPANAREVSDVTGAGDTVVATLALALAAGATLAEAAMLANHAAGIVVGKFGPATLTATELAAAIEKPRFNV
jgi:D-beta-D-heptose 7-phosphate kinase/D-beta-D-heptose 1-phosphate adenosyltransferase